MIYPLMALLLPAAAAWYLSGRQRWVRNSVPPQHRAAALVTAFVLVTAIYVFVAEVPPDGASDNAWLIVLVPAWWCAMGALAFFGAALVPWPRLSRRAHAAAIVLFIGQGVVAVGILGILAVSGNEKDLAGLAFRSRMQLGAVIGVMLLLVLPTVHIALARLKAD